jgi:hypothetical protein
MLTEEAFAVAWARGQMLPLEQAIRVAFDENEIPTARRRNC